MPNNLHLPPPHHRQQIEALLRKHLPGVEVWAYGSRVIGQHHESSDLDLALRTPDLSPIPHTTLHTLHQAFSDSNSPILIEARDWTQLPDSFWQEIERGYVVLVGK